MLCRVREAVCPAPDLSPVVSNRRPAGIGVRGKESTLVHKSIYLFHPRTWPISLRLAAMIEIGQEDVTGALQVLFWIFIFLNSETY